MLMCWATADSSATKDKTGWPVFAVESADVEFVDVESPSTVVTRIDLINAESENPFELFRPHWNQTQYKANQNNNGCVWIPVCSIMEKLFNAESESELGLRLRFKGSKYDDSVETPRLKLVVRGVAVQGEWEPIAEDKATAEDQTTADDHMDDVVEARSIHEVIKSSPVFAFDMPESALKHQKRSADSQTERRRREGDGQPRGVGMSLFTEALSSGVKFNFTQTDYEWVPVFMQPVYNSILSELKSVSVDVPSDSVKQPSSGLTEQEDGQYDLSVEAFKMMIENIMSERAFNASTDLPISVDEWGFSPRVVLEVTDLTNASKPLRQNCIAAGSSALAMSAMRMIRDDSMGRSIRPKLVLEGSPIQAGFTLTEGFSTLNLRPSLLNEYGFVDWDITVSLAPFSF